MVKNGNFAEWVNYAYWWSFIEEGLRLQPAQQACFYKSPFYTTAVGAACVEQHCFMAWIAMSTSSLLERTYSNAAGTSSYSLSLTTVIQHLAQRCPSFHVRELSLCMRRSSGNISGAAGPEEVKNYAAGKGSTTTVSVVLQGQRSTVTGPRPHCLLNRWTVNSDYPAISRCLAHCRSSLLSPRKDQLMDNSFRSQKYF